MWFKDINRADFSIPGKEEFEMVLMISGVVDGVEEERARRNNPWQEKMINIQQTILKVIGFAI